MAELRDRFHSLDRLAVPDLWAEAEQRATAAVPEPLGRVGVPWLGLDLPGLTRSRPVRLALVLAALIVLLLAVALLAGGRGRFTSPLVFAIRAGVGGEGLYVVDRAGGDPKAIFKGVAYGISVSPDGQYVLFSADDGISRDPSYSGPTSVVTLMRTDGSSSRILVTGEASSAIWAPDSHAVAWVSGETDPTTLMVTGVGGGEPRRIAVPPRQGRPDTAWSPNIAWSPDNVHLAYGGFADAESECPTIASVLIVDTVSGEFVEIGPLYPAMLPVWAHDGRHFAAAVLPEGVDSGPCAALPADGFALVSVDIVTREVTTVMTGVDVAPIAWSADDHSILGLMAAGSGGYDAFAVPADGGAVTTLAHVGENPGVRSPDGSYLAATELDDESTEPYTYSLWVIDLADGQRRRVARDVPGSDGDGWPLWSPDGEWLAFHRESSSPTSKSEWPYIRRLDGQGTIWIVRPDGSDEQLIVDDSLGPDIGEVDWGVGK